MFTETPMPIAQTLLPEFDTRIPPLRNAEVPPPDER
jgi:hypothetical protein